MGVQPYSWARPPVGRAAPAARSTEDTPFVFHDAAGRRWSRIKRMVLGAAMAVVVLVGAVLLAAAHVAPGKAPWFSATAPQQVPNWPARAGGDPSAGPAVVAGGPGGGAGTAAAPATGLTPATPTATLGPSPRPSHGPQYPQKPKKTKPPFFPPF